MRNIFKTAFILAAALLSSGCIEETFPKGGTVTKEQLDASGEAALQYMLNGIPASMMNSGTAGIPTTY